MTPTKAEQLAATAHLAYRIGWQREAAAELRRLAAVEAERDKFASESAQHFIRGREWAERAGQMEAERDALQADYSRLMEKHNNLHINAMRDRAERDALRAALNLMTDAFLDTEGNHGPEQQEAMSAAFAAMKGTK